jgi:DNA-binding transcriptional ArsR family regulator
LHSDWPDTDPGTGAATIAKLAHDFALLSDPTRLSVLRTVIDHGETSVGAIAKVAGVSRFNASAHLDRLAAGGVVRRRRVASTVYYWADDEKLSGICSWLSESLKRRSRGAAAQTAMYDVRRATCQGGGGLWALLSHVRDLRNGGSLEVMTDDPLAETDIPAWTQKMGWKVAQLPVDYGQLFVAQRPA